MRIKKPNTSSILLGVLLGGVISLSFNVSAFKTGNSSTIPAEQLRKFSEVFARIQSDYVEEVDNEKLITNAIRGMLTGLDPHSAYLDPEEYKELQVGTSGEFGGLGIEVGMEDGFVKVISPIDDTPAKRAGLEAGDLIIRLDDEPVKGKTLRDAVKIMRGKPGEPIVLTIVREGKDKPFKVTIIRDIIRVKSVKKRILDKNYGYLRITSFQSNTVKNAGDAITDMIEENKGKLSGLVIDLRNNPGGVLSAAVGISDLFLEQGKIVYTEGRIADSKTTYNASGGDILEDSPIVVLVNQGSASASEIVSGALQDHKRALILGQKTFGKGSVQTVLPLDTTTAVKLTTARYFTPNGRSIQAKGIEPDIKVEPLKIESKKTKDEDEFNPLTEADLSGHLDDGSKKKEAPKKKEKTAEEKEKQQKEDLKNLASKDYQLFEALNILKGMNLIQSRK